MAFWWGMDFDAYVFLLPLVLVTLPALLFDGYHQIEDTVRLVGLTIYSCILYAAFAGKMIFISISMIRITIWFIMEIMQRNVI